MFADCVPLVLEQLSVKSKSVSKHLQVSRLRPEWTVEMLELLFNHRKHWDLCGTMYTIDVHPRDGIFTTLCNEVTPE